MRYHLLLLFTFSLISSFRASAQVEISGWITDESTDELDNVSIIAYTYPDSIPLGYAISNFEGFYKLSITAQSDSIRLVARSLGYSRESLIMLSQSRDVDFTLHSSNQMLEEVVVEAEPITEEGDALIYDVKAFTNNQDQSLEDVLKKMPGLEVLENGQIVYQGRSINKLYIEGKDLLESRYMLATQNIPPDAVTVVEVMKNHQPIRILQDVVHSIDPAINIVLKPGVTLTGIGEIGGGIPEIWRAKIAPMVFSKKHQIVNEVTSSNSGDDYLLKFEAVNLLEYLDYGEMIFQSKSPLLGNSQLTSDLFDRKDYNFNTSHSISSNYITSLKKGDIKVNIDAFYDKRKFDREDVLEFFAGNQNFELRQNDQTNFESFYFRPKLVYEHNQPDRYFKNTVKFKVHKKIENTNLTFNNADNLTQRGNETFVEIENLFDNIIKVGNTYLRLLSYSSYSKRPEVITINPAPLVSLPFDQNGENLSQRVQFESFSGFLGTSLIRKWKKLSLESKVGFNYFNDNLESSIEDGEAEIDNLDYQNNLQYSRLSPSVASRLSFRKKGLRLSLENEIRYENITLTDYLYDTTTTLRRPVLLPELLVTYKWKRATVRSNLFRRVNFAKIPGIYSGFVINNYRTTSRREVPILSNEQMGFLTALDIEVLKAFLMIHTEFRYTNSARNWITQYEFDESGANAISALEFEKNNIVNRSLRLGVDIFLLPLSTNLSMGLELGGTEESALITSIVANIQTTYINYELETNTSLSDDLSMGLTYKMGKRVGEFGSSATSFNQEIFGANLNYTIHNHHLSISNKLLDHSRSLKKITLLDLIYSYHINDGQTQLELAGRNLFNESVFVQTTIAPQTASTTSFPLRSRQLILSVRFHF